jgi:hypothetical protein
MAETDTDDSAFVREAGHAPADGLPEHLPPVEPPSAGFIVQLFLVPALIVMAIVGVWALFGKLAAEDASITQVLADLRSTNEHRRGPSMLRLAQLLQLDSKRDPARQQYVSNPQVASEAAALLDHWMAVSPPNADQRLKVLETQVFLTRTLGWFHTPAIVLPALQKAASIEPEPPGGGPEQPVRELQLDVRKGALASIAAVADRAGPDEARRIAADRPELVETLVDASGGPDEEPVIRQLGTFALGMFPVERAEAQLQASLVHADPKTRLNAAIALARWDSPAGYTVFEEAIRAGAEPSGAESAGAPQGSEEFENYVALKNSIKAVGELADQFEPAQRERLAELLRPISETHDLHEIRQAATKAGELLGNEQRSGDL